MPKAQISWGTSGLSEHTEGHQPHQDTQHSWTKMPPTQCPALELLAAGMGTATASVPSVTADGGKVS